MPNVLLCQNITVRRSFMHENKDVKKAFLFRGILVILRPLSWYALFTAAILVHIVYGEYKVRPNHPLVYVAAAFVIFVPYLLGWLTEVVRLSAFSGTENKAKHDTCSAERRSPQLGNIFRDNNQKKQKDHLSHSGSLL